MGECECFQDPDIPKLDGCIPDCESDACIAGGCTNFNQTLKLCWCPYKYFRFSLSHCYLCYIDNKTYKAGQRDEEEKDAEECAEIKAELAEDDLFCRDSDVGWCCCPCTLVGSALGCAGGIMNVLCSVACCITGCCLKCCENENCRCGKNAVGPNDDVSANDDIDSNDHVGQNNDVGLNNDIDSNDHVGQNNDVGLNNAVATNDDAAP